ncbi:hypothetical protein C6P46_005903 [Rhodotorula mucilaginosa]|uniref:Alpha N-terminal protein methyltransferase 1 n=1 Tax=Rhodotorula mucilaginosa TaxID=5537 RepID=A0A9P6W6W0_RHOMI|nr:hypothetical protein C6P46_005903 [Rhodotorula mucilaginosa]
MTNPKPDFEAGVRYWEHTSADVDGVLGGYGEQVVHLPLHHSITVTNPQRTLTYPQEHAGPSPRRDLVPLAHPLPPPSTLDHPTTAPRLLFLLLDPSSSRTTLPRPRLRRRHRPRHFDSPLALAKKNALRASEHGWTSLREGEGAPAGERKAVRIWKAGLQHFDPTCPGKPVDATKGSVELFAQVGRDEPSWASSPPGAPRELNVQEEGYDLIMIQWCIGHLSDDELVAFLKRSRAALRQQPTGGPCEGYILLKENVCKDETERLFDEDDSSYTRSDKVFREIFERAGLTLYRREVQQGFPEELFPVIAYALR